MVDDARVPAARKSNGNNVKVPNGVSGASIEEKVASLSYSFSQHMPAPRKKKSPFDRNFPELNRAEPRKELTADPLERRDLTKRTWDRTSNANSRTLKDPKSSASTASPDATKAKSTPGQTRSATAAEIVAHRSEQKPKSAVGLAQKSELELFSKLVPTTSAVPRATKAGANATHGLSAFADGKSGLAKRLSSPEGSAPRGAGSSAAPAGGAVESTDAPKTNGGLVRLRATSSSTTTMSASLRSLRKGSQGKEDTVKAKSAASPEALEGLADPPIPVPLVSPSAGVAQSSFEQPPAKLAAGGSAGRSDGDYIVSPVFGYSASSLFEFRDRVNELKQTTSGDMDGLTSETSGPREEAAPVDMRVFSTPSSSSLYIPSTMDAAAAAAAEPLVADEADVDESVLPPLPEADNHHEFESVLRQMGWTPEEEYEEPRGSVRHDKYGRLKGFDVRDSGGHRGSSVTPANTTQTHTMGIY